MTDKIHITKHSGKMEDIFSISTSRNKNEHCKNFSKCQGSICHKCYAERYLSLRPALRKALERNTEILTKEIIPIDEMPILNASVFRLESFGDLINETHAANYLNLIKRNPQTQFGWWTKHPELIAKALDGENPPENVQIIQSSFYINKPDKPKYDWISKVFTVYDKEYIKENNVDINCGSKDSNGNKKRCIDCKKCYLDNGIKNISEELK